MFETVRPFLSTYQVTSMFKLHALALAAAGVPIYAFLGCLDVAMTMASSQAAVDESTPAPFFYEAPTASVVDLGRIEVVGKRSSLADDFVAAQR